MMPFLIHEVRSHSCAEMSDGRPTLSIVLTNAMVLGSILALPSLTKTLVLVIKTSDILRSYPFGVIDPSEKSLILNRPVLRSSTIS